MLVAVLLAVALQLSRPVTAQVRLLIANDLSDSTLSSALLLQGGQAGSNASSACEAYGEQLLSAVNQDIQDELNYLVFRGDLSNSSRIHVSANFSGNNVNGTTRLVRLRYNRRQQGLCQVYTVGEGSVSSIDCSTELVGISPSMAEASLHVETPEANLHVSFAHRALRRTCDNRQPVLCTNSAAPTRRSSTASPSEVAAQFQSTLSTSSGDSFTGARDSRSFRFLGIPFAAPPTGDLRFLAAQPYNGSYSNVSALEFGNVCSQAANSTEGLPASIISEDCLTLNIFSPVLPGQGNSTRLLPVAFWIYGGAFITGSARIPLYDGGNTASRGDVLVVTTNYRLGLLGNLASNSLNGSQGITDQIQSLRWVQEHIRDFGGDPSQVTIYGESAGAQSVLALMSSTPAKGLFQQAISQSSPWNPFLSREVYTSAIYPALLNATNCTGADEQTQLTCLQALNSSSLLDDTDVFSLITDASTAAQKQYSSAGLLVSAVEPLLPVVGTGIVDDLPDKLIHSGQLPSAGISFMVGNVRDEGTIFVDSVPQLANPVPASNFTLQYLLQAAVNEETIAAVNQNPDLFGFNTTDPDALRDLAGSIQTQYVWQCPLQQVLGIANQRSTFSSLYSFVFDKGVLVDDGPAACTPESPSGVDRVCHSEDILQVFATSNVIGLSYGPQGSFNSLTFNQYVNDVWTSFIRTGNPQPSADYLRVRGRAYNTTLTYSQSVPFEAFSPNSTTALQLINDPPQHSSVLDQAQCQAFADAGFLYNKVGQNNTATNQTAAR